MNQFEIAARDPANILAGNATTSGTIITIPAGRTWAGWVSLNASLMVAASGAQVSSRPTVSIAGAGATPAAGVIFGVWVSVPAQGTGTTGQVTANDRTFLVVAAGAGAAATLTLQPNSASAASATASGVLIA